MRVLIVVVTGMALAALVLVVQLARAEEYQFGKLPEQFYLPPVFVEGKGVLICFSSGRERPINAYVYERCGLSPKSADDLNLICTFARGGVRKADCVRSGV